MWKTFEKFSTKKVKESLFIKGKKQFINILTDTITTTTFYM